MKVLVLIGTPLTIAWRCLNALAERLEITLEAQVTLGYRLEQLLHFFCALQTSHVHHNSLIFRSRDSETLIIEQLETSD